ncbi:MAG TPA: SH3 domain-containing protein [Flexilinea sp.]|jgi:hypothetical protein|nr:SH3 domain-containing protein [Flexilinea sp.]HPL57471.1 SH3 domain-containing protein [Flexilinea sp.]HRY21980.1 SH3 domain-containing protein [Flexilinea sp.]
MADNHKNRIFNLSTGLISLCVAAFIFLGIILLIVNIGPSPAEEKEDALAQLTVIPMPTITPTSAIPSEKPDLSVKYISPEGFSVGAYVKIENTQGAGLKIRPDPGTGGEVTFIASEGDIFIIIDGPDERNGYTWWKLQGFEDPSLVGWGASKFFSLVAPAADQIQSSDIQ